MPENSITRDARKLLAFGSGAGIEIGAKDLEVVVARVRLSRVHVLGHLAIENFAETPAAEWGSRYATFLKSLGMSHLTATVLLPRREVIVRQIALPGVASKDVEGAIRFQLDSLHPYGEDEVVWGWSPLSYGAVLVGIVRRTAVDRYHQLFVEAGIAVSSFTFSAAAVHAAVRLNGFAYDSGFIAVSRTETGAVEVYGESPSRPVYSAEFSLPVQRAAVVALSELRLPPETAPLTLEEVLPKPEVNPVENDLSRNALPYATALAGACPGSRRRRMCCRWNTGARARARCSFRRSPWECWCWPSPAESRCTRSIPSGSTCGNCTRRSPSWSPKRSVRLRWSARSRS